MITIEPYRPGDRAAVVAFAAAIQEHERAWLPALLPGDEIGEAYVSWMLGRAAERNGAVLVARDGAAAAGFTCAWVDADLDLLLREEARTHGYVSDLYVAPAWRRQGLARRLLTAVGRAMAARGCRRLRLCCKAANGPALAFYEADGFRPHEVVLEKDLPAPGETSGT